jgi:hypothetical protein
MFLEMLSDHHHWFRRLINTDVHSRTYQTVMIVAFKIKGLLLQIGATFYICLL